MSEPLDVQIYQALSGDPTLSGLVGGNIFRLRLPPDFFATPGSEAITYQRISTQPTYVMQPASGEIQGSFGWARYQFTVWTQSATAADSIDQIVVALLNVLNQFNAAAFPTSPEVVTQAPSFIIGRSSGSDGNTDPPTDFERIDVKFWYQNQ